MAYPQDYPSLGSPLENVWKEKTNEAYFTPLVAQEHTKNKQIQFQDFSHFWHACRPFNGFPYPLMVENASLGQSVH